MSEEEKDIWLIAYKRALACHEPSNASTLADDALSIYQSRWSCVDTPNKEDACWPFGSDELTPSGLTKFEYKIFSKFLDESKKE
ncbi:hypothetical protein [Stenotrophomonas maltophilia]|uniref:hypothetical protein n=1 Tax=Stenotrophomonas maltophilia TaxID=40324 RepID=UPI0034D4AE9B